MPKTPKNFYIFRHGECPLNVSGRIQGQTFDGELDRKRPCSGPAGPAANCKTKTLKSSSAAR